MFGGRRIAELENENQVSKNELQKNQRRIYMA